MRPALEPRREVRHLSGCERPLEDRRREAVDLEKECSRNARDDRCALPPRGPADDVAVVRVVGLVEQRGENDLHDRENEGGKETVPEVDLHAGQDRAAEPGHGRVQQEREEAEREEREREREPQRERPEDCVEDRHDRDQRDAVREVVDHEAGKARGEPEEHHGFDQPEGRREDEAPGPGRRGRSRHRASIRSAAAEGIISSG